MYLPLFWKLQVSDRGDSMVRFLWKPSSGLQTANFLLCPDILDWGKKCLWNLFQKRLIPFIRSMPLWSNHLLKTLHPNTITLRVKITIYGFWGSHWVHSTLPHCLLSWYIWKLWCLSLNFAEYILWYCWIWCYEVLYLI